MLTKRNVIGSLLGIIAAPAVVRSASLMPVRAPKIIPVQAPVFEPPPYDPNEPWWMRRIREEHAKMRMLADTNRFLQEELNRLLSQQIAHRN